MRNCEVTGYWNHGCTIHSCSARVGGSFARSAWTVRNCKSFRFLHGGSCRHYCRPREPAGDCLQSCRGIHLILFRRTFTTPSFVCLHCCMGREMQRSRAKMCAVPPGSAEEVEALAMLGIPAALRKSSSLAPHETRTLVGAGATISRTRPPVTPTCAVTSKSAVPPPDLSTLPKHSQSWLKFCTNPGAHNHWRRSLEWIWVGQQRKRSTSRFSTAADQEGEGTRDWATTPRCTAFYTPVTNIPELSLRRRGRRCE